MAYIRKETRVAIGLLLKGKPDLINSSLIEKLMLEAYQAGQKGVINGLVEDLTESAWAQAVNDEHQYALALRTEIAIVRMNRQVEARQGVPINA